MVKRENKQFIVAKLEEYVRNKLVKSKSSRLFHEVKTFIWNNGKPQAMRGYNDDLIMSLAIACWVRDTALTVNARNVEYKKAFLNSMVYSSTKFDTKIRGQSGYKTGGQFDKIEQNKQIEQMQKFSSLYAY